MAINNRDLSILERGVPGYVKEDTEYVLDNKTFQDIGEIPIEERESPEDENIVKAREVEETLQIAIDAISGSRKVIEQLYGQNTTVDIKPHEKEVKKSVRRIFNSDSNVVTFEMYQQALAELRIEADKVMDKVIDVQGQTS